MSKQVLTRNLLGEKYPDSFFCVFCEQLLENPSKTDCGCKCCKLCLIDFISQSREKQCPKCKSIILIDTGVILRDNEANRELSRIKIKCLNEGCSAILKLSSLRCHISELCSLSNFECLDCHEEMKLSEKADHLHKTCPMKKELCIHCQQYFPLVNLKNLHLNHENITDRLCSNWSGECPYRCSLKLHQSLKSHFDVCPEVKLLCPIYDCGSKIKRMFYYEHVTNCTK